MSRPVMRRIVVVVMRITPTPSKAIIWVAPAPIERIPSPGRPPITIRGPCIIPIPRIGPSRGNESVCPVDIYVPVERV